MVNFMDPDRDPEADPEVLMISVTSQEIDPEIDVENMKLKEAMKCRLSGDAYFGFTFSFFSITFT